MCLSRRGRKTNTPSLPRETRNENACCQLFSNLSYGSWFCKFMFGCSPTPWYLEISGKKTNPLPRKQAQWKRTLSLFQQFLFLGGHFVRFHVWVFSNSWCLEITWKTSVLNMASAGSCYFLWPHHSVWILVYFLDCRQQNRIMFRDEFMQLLT